MTSPKKDSGMVARDDPERRIFSSYKFDLIDCFSMAPTLTPLQRLVGILLVQALNVKTRTCYLSARLLADKLGVTPRSIELAIAKLKAGKWIEVVGKTKHGTNRYRILDTHVNAVLDLQILRRDARTERRGRPKADSERNLNRTEPQFGTEPNPLSDKHLH